ncbi:hypothetical protein ACFV19_02840 [Streptomyces griseoluteus]
MATLIVGGGEGDLRRLTVGLLAVSFPGMPGLVYGVGDGRGRRR